MGVDAEAAQHDVALRESVECCPLTLKLDEFYSYPATFLMFWLGFGKGGLVIFYVGSRCTAFLPVLFAMR